MPAVVLDSDMTTIETMRKFGVKGLFGDPARPELLEAAGVAEAQVIVVAVDDRDTATPDRALCAVTPPRVHIVARARDRVHVYELFQAGANDIVRETFDSSIRAGRYVLENAFSDTRPPKVSEPITASTAPRCAIWPRSGCPVSRHILNEAYVARAKQLDRDLESALMEELHDVRPMAEDPAEVLQAMLFPDMEDHLE